MLVEKAEEFQPDSSEELKPPELNYEEARNTLIGVRRMLDESLRKEEIERYTLVLSGSAAYEFREPTDLDCFLIYSKKHKGESHIGEDSQIDEGLLYEGKGTESEIHNETYDEVLGGIREMLTKGLSGHRRITINGVNVDLQISQERIFKRQLNETLPHARNRLLRRDFFYMACDRDDIPDHLRKAVWFVSPLLSTLDSRVADDLEERAVSRYTQLSELLDYENPERDSLDGILGESFERYLKELGYLESEEVALAIESVKRAYKGEVYEKGPLKEIFGKLIRGIVLDEDLPYSFSKSFRAKLSNYWNGQNFISHGISAGAVLIGGSQIVSEGKPVFEKVDMAFLAEDVS